MVGLLPIRRRTPFRQAEGAGVEEDHEAVFREEVEFFFCHGVVAAHGNHRFVVVAHVAYDLHFLFREGFGACFFIKICYFLSGFSFHHPVRVRQLPFQSVRKDLRRPALAGAHGPDEDYISLFHRYLGFGMSGSPFHRPVLWGTVSVL